MDMHLKQQLLTLWNAYFAGTGLPIIYYYTNDPAHAEIAKPAGDDFRCIFQDLTRVRAGQSCAFDRDALGCMGGKIYLGFEKNPAETQGPRLCELMSSGIRGMIKSSGTLVPGLGKYKKSAAYIQELVKPEALQEVSEKYIVFKRWDLIEEDDSPLAAVFFATADVISGLFALANYDEPGLHGVITPYASGCGAIVMFPYKELGAEHPKAVIGMFDIMPRRFVSKDTLTFAAPWPKLLRMVQHMEESFLITEHWETLQRR